MTGSVVQVSISPGGVPKRAIQEGRVGALGVEGDSHNHPHIHGGPRKALLLIAEEVLHALAEQGYPVYPGALGENITMRGIAPGTMRAGQRYRIGETIVELTTVRIPCNAIKVYGADIGARIYDARVKQGDISSPAWGWSGFYASVVAGGTVRAGDPIVLLEEIA
jgi:MOSC domain-containing protein YiiM